MVPPAAPAATERTLRALPERFGLEQSLLDHVAAAKRLPGHLARPGDDVVGLLLVERHFPTAAEIHRMAVAPAHHRTGVGRRLVAAAEAELAADGVRLLQVKTRSDRPTVRPSDRPTVRPSDRPTVRPSDRPTLTRAYRGTRGFSATMGFAPLEVLADLGPGNPCLIMVKTPEPA